MSVRIRSALPSGRLCSDALARLRQRATVHIDILLALASLGLAVWESRRARRGDRNARVFVIFLICAVAFKAFAVRGLSVGAGQ